MSVDKTASVSYMEAVSAAAVVNGHPYGGLAFPRLGEHVCYAKLLAVDSVTVEISGMYAPVRGGGRHAMSLLSLLADLHGVRLYLVAASSVPSRMDTSRVVEWYRGFGFLAAQPEFSGVPMIRLPRPVLP